VDCQIHPDSTDFISPIQHAIAISGSFGELRPNHFHAGIDLKSSKGVDGDVVLSAEKGFVSRIKIQSGGYGNALYIDHPNGYTTVYAHLESFNSILDSFVQAQQYALKSFPLDIYLSSNEFRFAKGDTIGFMGNSGRSYGTHLHFEIRETISEEVMNPFLFKILPIDTRPPQIKKVLLYALDKDYIPSKTKVLKVKKTKAGSLYISNKAIEVDGWRMGIAFDSYDWMDGSWNKNGIYQANLFEDDSLLFSIQFDKFSFDQSRYANACIDYERKQTKGGNRLMKLYTEPGNKLDLYRQNIPSGVIELSAEKAKHIRVESFDFHGNKSEIKFLVKRKKEVSPVESKVFNYYFHYDSINNIYKDDFKFTLPAGSLYRNGLFTFSKNGNSFSIGDKTIPCHKYFSIEFDLGKYPNMDHDKVCLLFKDGKRFKSFGAHVNNGILKSRANRFGTYKIAQDTIPPTISKVSKNKTYKHGDLIDFTVKDNFEVLGSANEINVHAYINSEWVISVFDKKKDKIRVAVPQHFPLGKNNILIIAEDNQGNMSRYSSSILIK